MAQMAFGACSGWALCRNICGGNNTIRVPVAGLDGSIGIEALTDWSGNLFSTCGWHQGGREGATHPSGSSTARRKYCFLKPRRKTQRKACSPRKTQRREEGWKHLPALREQYRQTQILLPQAKAQDAMQSLLAPQDAKARGGMEASPIAARKTPSCHERRQLEWPYATT
ncbi:hypothetical protein ABG768_026162 [Culter alburnus]|uniref:Uncharacterized protein n=1 Tax=Culter alburnus TaxID=194366 RepID=A0AAW2A9V1_CULAL